MRSGGLRLALAALGTVLLAGEPAHAQASGSVNAQASVKVLKPLRLTVLRNMDFGTIVMGNITTSQTIGVTTSGRSCGSGGQVTCIGAFSTARFQVTGTNNQLILITTATPTATLTNADGARLTLTPVLPGSATMPNSGNQGVFFEVGGRLEITPGTPDGLYAGTIDVQVAYQ